MKYHRALSLDEIRNVAPSAFAVSPYQTMSTRYAFIPTSQVIEGMIQAGFGAVSATQSLCRVEGKQDFTKHMVKFRSLESLAQAAVVGEYVPEISLVNSHDGTSAYKLFFGLFRFTCSNGAMVSDGLVGSINIRHTGNVIGEVVESTGHLLGQAPKVLDTVKEWKGITLTVPEQKLLAESAHRLRFDDPESNMSRAISPESLLQTRRYDDNGGDLWHVFNRIQENAVRGGIRGYAHRQPGEIGPAVRRVRSREVKGIDQNVRLNRELWTLAEKMAELKHGELNRAA